MPGKRLELSTLWMLGLLGLGSTVQADAGPSVPPAAAGSTSGVAGPAVLGTVSVSVQGVSSAQGAITALLFASEDGFPAKEPKAARRVSVPASVGAVTLHFERVPAGTYAITVYHDENGNGRLDKNWIGIPKEPVAVSNNAKGHMGPPKFKDAKFIVESEQKNLQISLIKI